MCVFFGEDRFFVLNFAKISKKNKNRKADIQSLQNFNLFHKNPFKKGID